MAPCLQQTARSPCKSQHPRGVYLHPRMCLPHCCCVTRRTAVLTPNPEYKIDSFFVLRFRLCHFVHDAFESIGAFFSAELPSGFPEPLGLLLVLNLRRSLLLYACGFSHRASHSGVARYV